AGRHLVALEAQRARERPQRVLCTRRTREPPEEDHGEDGSSIASAMHLSSLLNSRSIVGESRLPCPLPTATSRTTPMISRESSAGRGPHARKGWGGGAAPVPAGVR